MHPIERLRHVARAEGVGHAHLVREAAGALASFGADPQALVTACRRLVERHPAVGPMWWLAARMLAAAEPVPEAWRVADELDADNTAQELCDRLPDEATVLVIGWPEISAEALRRRADLEVLTVSCGGDGDALARRLRAGGVDALVVTDSGVGAAATEADLVLLEADAASNEGMLATAGSRAAAAVARQCGTPVWGVAGVGRMLPDALWQALIERLAVGDVEPWDRPEEVVPFDLVDALLQPPGGAVACPLAPELLKPLD